jgi:hypothetical protein
MAPGREGEYGSRKRGSVWLQEERECMAPGREGVYGSRKRGSVWLQEERECMAPGRDGVYFRWKSAFSMFYGLDGLTKDL